MASGRILRAETGNDGLRGGPGSSASAEFDKQNAVALPSIGSISTIVPQFGSSRLHLTAFRPRLTELPLVGHGFTGFYLALLGFTGFYWVLPCLTGFC